MNAALPLFLAVGCFGAPITETIVNCTHVCSDSDTTATADISGLSISASASYSGSGSRDALIASALASLDEDLMITLHGGSGTAYFTPCISTVAYDAGFLLGAGSSVTASFGTFVAIPNSNCSYIGPVLPISFNTPTDFHLHLAATAYADNSLPHSNGAFASARFSGLIVPEGVTYDLAESLPGGVPPADVVAAPEPAGVSLLVIGLLTLFAGANRNIILSVLTRRVVKDLVRT